MWLPVAFTPTAVEGWPEKEICRPLGQGNFSPALEAGSPDGKSLEEMKEEYERLRDKEFAAHVCAEHPRASNGNSLNDAGSATAHKFAWPDCSQAVFQE